MLQSLLLQEDITLIIIMTVLTMIIFLWGFFMGKLSCSELLEYKTEKIIMQMLRELDGKCNGITALVKEKQDK